MRRQQVGNTFGDVWFDVDIENLEGEDQFNGHDIESRERTIGSNIASANTDFRPKEGIYRLTIPPSKISSKDNVDRQIEILGESTIVWQSLIPSVFGEATVSIRLEDTNGSLVNGRVLNVQSRADLTTRFRRGLGSGMIVTAIFTAMIPAISAISAILPLLS